MIFAPGETTVYDVLRSNAISYGRIRQVGDRADTAYHSLQLSNAGGIGVNLNGRATLRMIPPADSVHFLILHGFHQVLPRAGQPVFLQAAIIKHPIARLCRDQCGGWRSKTTTPICYPSRRLTGVDFSCELPILEDTAEVSGVDGPRSTHQVDRESEVTPSLADYQMVFLYCCFIQRSRVMIGIL